MGKNCIINGFFFFFFFFFFFLCGEMDFLRNGDFYELDKWIYVKLAIAFFFFFINYERTNKENDTFFFLIF